MEEPQRDIPTEVGAMYCVIGGCDVSEVIDEVWREFCPFNRSKSAAMSNGSAKRSRERFSRGKRQLLFGQGFQVA